MHRVRGVNMGESGERAQLGVVVQVGEHGQAFIKCRIYEAYYTDCAEYTNTYVYARLLSSTGT
jgi:hypothetical protein